MSAYQLFETLVVAGFLFYSVRQVLPLIPGAVPPVLRLARALRIPANWIVPARLASADKAACSACSQCSGCAPKNEPQQSVIHVQHGVKSGPVRHS